MGPLSGYKILDLTAMVSGPMATQTLGDMGADIIKVEPPGSGDLIRKVGTGSEEMSTWFAGINRSKRSIVINLKSIDGVNLLKKIVQQCDVIIQNFRPGVVERLGICEQSLRSVNPDLIYISISGFGQEGPYSKKPAYDLVVQGLSGIVDIQNANTSSEPDSIKQAIVDKITAQNVVQGALAALLARERGEGGQHIRISMLDSAISFIWPDTMTNYTMIDEATECRQPDISEFFRVIKLTDGNIVVSAATDTQIKNLLIAFNRKDLLDDSRFKNASAVLDNIHVFWEELEKIGARNMSVKEILSKLNKADVPAAPVLKREDVVVDEHVIKTGVLREYYQPSIGTIRQPVPSIKMSKTPINITKPAPILGEDTVDIISEYTSLTRKEITQLFRRGTVA